MANPFFIQSESVAPQLQQLGGLIGQYGQQQRQQQAQEQAQQRQQQQIAGLQEVMKTGDMTAVADYMISNPDMSQQVQANMLRGMGIRDEAQKDRLKTDTFKMLSEPQNIESYLQSRIAEIEGRGGDATDTKRELAAYQADPEGFQRGLRGFASTTFSPEWKQWSEAMTAGEPEPMTAYQQATIEGKKVDQELRRAEMENKRDENRLKRETDDLKRQELKQKIEAREQKTAEAKENRSTMAQGVVDQGQMVLDLIGDIERHPGLSSAVGAKGATSAFGLFDEPIAGTEAAGAKALIDTLEAKNFLTAIGQFKSAGGAGALSDAEGRRLSAAVSSLSRDQSETDFKKSLNTIRTLVRKQVTQARKQAIKKKGASENFVEVDQGAVQSGNFSSLWGG